ncbi:uncharacterized protein ASPGLDRAFT_28802 [Aspergillus glaucus CBS 516.65]|uniref:DNA repair protein RAD51 homolog 3 n=1 Tax=Aspergillus glaucus CBS 516.65 TaxID=1160497 RepID=A0A1L9VA32_ASPGL|nr:hypothetical protein ASPGLDRAFT_28802 [Aspergillus glaucus CBS 516.65]OJJ80781.1 hypothetical protein ASPGLDRAFT_28802 [Aspergillus glaucus CBS 516.65]
MSQQDVLGLTSEESHRVIPISASQSLHASTAPATPGAISTGLSRLDEALCTPSGEDVPGSSTPSHKGICCGQVTEVYGPPGVGKTSLALSTAVNALLDGRKVIWIDTMSPLPRPRLRKMLRKALESTESDKSEEDLVQNLLYFHTQSLPHLIALLFRPPKSFPPDDTSLLIIDSISGPFPSYFPNPTELRARLAQSDITDKSKTQWLMNRRWNVTSDLANQLMKLATTRRLAVLAINQTHTKIKGQPRATLCPVLSGGAWENCISTRIVLYRDFCSVVEEDLPVLVNARFAEVMKQSGRILVLRLEENIVPFATESDGLRGIEKKQPPSATPQVAEPREFPSQPASQPASQPGKPSQTPSQPSQPAGQPTSQRKRKVDEIADSEDDEDDSDGDYGWAEDDDTLLQNPEKQ